MSAFFCETKAAGTTVQITFDSDDEVNTIPKYGIGYWSIRGLGAPLTMMLCAAKVPFSLFLYDILEKEEGWTSEYFAAKPEYIKEYDAPLWNLPFCIDRENKEVICQTNAVFSFLGRVCNMLGSDGKTTSQCEQLLCEIYDLRNIMVGYAYGSPDTKPETVMKSAKGHFKKLEAWLEIQAKTMVVTNAGNDAKKAKVRVTHLVGGKFSAPDFHLYEMIDQFQAFAEFYEFGELFSDHPRLKDFYEGFAALEENQFYLNSWLHKELPFNNCMANFGSLPGPQNYVHGESAPLAKWRGKGVIQMSPKST